MTDSARHPPDEPQVTAPQSLVDDLAALYGRPAPVPEHVDEAILAMARRRLAPRRRPVRVVRWAAAAAAAAVLAVALVPAARHALWPGPAAAIREDIDGNGRLDILDAFALARHLVGEEPVKMEWDLNRDGVVDAADVDDVAYAAVRLERGALQ